MILEPNPPSAAAHRWSGARLARFGFLVGLGWDSRAIADDPSIVSTPSTVRVQARRFGLTFRAASGFRLPYAVLGRYEAAAVRRGVSCDDLIHLILLNAGADDALIDNILDD